VALAGGGGRIPDSEPPKDAKWEGPAAVPARLSNAEPVLGAVKAEQSAQVPSVVV
jgi:hypothetical protein